jgi:hypothetical protein
MNSCIWPNALSFSCQEQTREGFPFGWVSAAIKADNLCQRENPELSSPGESVRPAWQTVRPARQRAVVCRDHCLGSRTCQPVGAGWAQFWPLHQTTLQRWPMTDLATMPARFVLLPIKPVKDELEVILMSAASLIHSPRLILLVDPAAALRWLRCPLFSSAAPPPSCLRSWPSRQWIRPTRLL